MYDITPIKQYLLFLKNRMGLSVTLHPMCREPLILPSELMAFNIHDNSYCSYIKSCEAARRHCVAKQREVLARCENGPFCGVCHAGVQERVYPIKRAEQTVGFLCVGGYRAENGCSYLQKTAQKFALPHAKLSTLYATLKPSIPPCAELNTLIAPLLQMLELAYSKLPADSEESMVERAKRYLRQYRTETFSMEEMCRHLFCSRSHISHQFKRETGKSIRAYLTELRLSDARTLLLHSHLSVSEIADAVGFGDANYFSNVFRKFEGQAPLAYRRSHTAGGSK